MKANLYPVAAVLLLLLPVRPLIAADETPPAVAQVTPAPGTVTSLTEITVRFTEPVSEVGPLDFLVNGLAADSVTNVDESYTFRFPQPAYGTVLITWDINHTIVDLAGNRFNETGAGAQWQYTFQDIVPPTVANLTPAAGATVSGLTQVEVLFNEAVTGVDAADVLINGVGATNLVIAGAGRYLFQFPAPPSGVVQMQWRASHGILDFAGNAFGGGAWNYTLDPAFGVPDVRISEFLASNVGGLLDENNEPQDWIEIENRGSTTVNLSGWSLTDDPEDLGRWVFPATNLASGQFLIVFASGKDRRAPTNSSHRLHTNFRLNSSGSFLALYNGESPRQVMTQFAPEFPEQRNDHSYGFDSDGALKYFSTPTPGVANGASQISGVLPPPHFNVERGVFESPFTLYLNSSIPGASIRYTVDGSEPTAGNGTLYTGPLNVTNTVVVRAYATKPDTLPSITITHTYLFLSSVVAQNNAPPGYPVGPTVMQGYPADYEMDPEIVTNSAYGPQMLGALKALPAVAISTSIVNMFGPTNGIYTHTSESQTQFRGILWERPCSVEFIPTNGNDGFQANCGIRMQGNASRNPQKTPKHPFRLMFRGDYGDGRLPEQVFPDSPVRSFNTLVMRADFNNSWLHWDPGQRGRGTRIRDAWVKDTWRAMGHLGSHSRFFHLYINGLYWGIYEFGERIDASFAANYLGGDDADYDAIASKPTEATDGDIIAYNNLANSIRNRDQRFLTNYTAVLAQLEIENFADYMLLNFYGANQDWGNDSNWNAVRRRPNGKFKYVAWDGEQLLVDVNHNRVSNTDVPGQLHTSLVNSPEYRLTFADRAHKHLLNGGALSTNAVAERWAARAAELRAAIVAESARWGDYRRDVHQYQNPPYLFYRRDENWQVEVDRLLTSYFPQRGAVFLQQLRVAGLYPSNAAPVLSQHGGRVARDYALTMSATNEIYYTLDGSDPREFGTGAISPSAALYAAGSPVILSNSVIVKARARFTTNWSALADATFQVAELTIPLRITEIMYNPVGGDAYEYLELKNISGYAINVGSYSFSGITYIFPPQTVLAPGATIVLASDANPGNWSGRYGVTPFGYFDGSLSNGGEKIAIRDPEGNVVYSLDYNDENGWDTLADTAGYSLEIRDVFGDPDNPANWFVVENGSPGTASAPPPPGQVILNELLAENVSSVPHAGTYPDFVELRNTAGSSADISGWRLTDDDNPVKYVFPAGTTIPANGYLVVWCDTNATPGLHAGFALGRNGETVVLYDGGGVRVDAITFGLQIADHAVGRIDGVWRLTTPTPNGANTAVALGSTTALAINEWLANPAPGAGADWVELYNASSVPVALNGIFLGNDRTISPVASLSFIAANGFAVLFADESSGADQLDFKLPGSGGAIVLYDEAAIERQRVTYGPQVEGVTQGRLPDGAPNIVSFLGSASPRTTNYINVYTGPVLNEALAVNDYAYTNAFNGASDWIELYNPGAAAFDLSGMALNDEPSAQGAWIFPPGTGIQPNAYLIVLFDDSRPATLFAGPVLNTGRALDGESDDVYLLNTAGQVVDSVAFGFQVRDLPIGRSGGQWHLLERATPGSANAAPAPLTNASGLRINEWMANPLDGNDWFEIYNSSAAAVALEGVFVSDTPSLAGLSKFRFGALSFIGPNGFVRVIADEEPGDGRDHVNFALAAEGESLRLLSAGLGLIDGVDFGPQSPGVSEGRLLDGGTSIVQFPETPTPAAANYLPLDNIFISEAVVSYAPIGSNVAIYNANGFSVDVVGWYLGHARNLKAFRIYEGIRLNAGGHLFFDPFPLPGPLDSGRGEQLFLSEADPAGNLSGRRAAAVFGGAEANTVFGQYQTSIGWDFVQITDETLGTHNSGISARVGPLVISEIMYHPALLDTNDNTADEYIEIHNPTQNPVTLTDPAQTGRAWRLREAVRFVFPTNLTIPAGGYVVVVGFDPGDVFQQAVFRSRFGVPQTVDVLGPFEGNLANSGESIVLERPGNASGGGLLPDVLVERVHYGNVAPWPFSGNGDGSSLQRLVALEYGNEPLNWQAAPPSAGRANAAAPTRPPVILVHPVSRTVPETTPVHFDVVAVGSAPLTYQWIRDGLEIPGETLPAYSFSAELARAGTYRVRVSNSAGSVLSEPAIISIGDLPVITQQPEGTTVPSDSDVTLTVAASGSGPLSYQWRFNGQDLPGADSPTLALSNLQTAQSGDYSAVVKNSAGVVASAAARVQVFQRVRIISHPQPRAVPVGTSVTFSVNAVGTGQLRYQWSYQGQPLAGATDASYTLSAVDLWSSGDYAVTVSDDRSFAMSQPATLTVTGVRPVFTKHPLSQTVAVGENVTFDVSVYGSWPLTNRWRRGGNNIHTNILAARQTNDTFTLFNIQTNHAALYAVGAIALGGQNTLSSNAFITVVIPPTEQTVIAGENAALRVVVANPQPANANLVRLQWQFYGTNLPGATNATLSFTNVQSSQDGPYAVVVTLTNSLPAPATFSTFLTVFALDTDADGMPDDWETAYGLDHTIANADVDSDGDTMTNLEEFIAGTEPNNGLSYLKIEIQGAGLNLVRFHAKARKSYTVQYASSVTGPWSRLTNVSPEGADRVVEIPDNFTGPPRYYRLLTPTSP